MTCHCCAQPPHRHGLCLGHALIYGVGPWRTVDEFILSRRNKEGAI